MSRLIKQIILILYVLALALPAAVQAGVRLEPTAVFELERDIAASRCASGKTVPDQHHAGDDCCILCQVPQAARDQTAIPESAAFLSRPPAFATPRTQTRGLALGSEARPPQPRGPPLSL